MEPLNPKVSADSAKVLVVDDDASTRLMVREVLGSAGFVVEEAGGGRQGLLLVESFRPDIILLDILMPEMDGFQTLELLRGQAHGSSCPVVMITGLQDPGAVESAYERGATDFVTKPINWSLLRYRINYVLRSSKQRPDGDTTNLENALRLAGVGRWRWDLETDRLAACGRFLHLLGLQDNGPVSPRFALSRIQRSDRSQVLNDLRRLISGDAAGALETSFRVLADGCEERCIRLRAEAIQANGGVVGLAGILEDVSETKRLERTLHELQSFLRSAQEAIQDLPEPELVEANEANR